MNIYNINIYIYIFEWIGCGTDILSFVKHNFRNIFRFTIYNIFSTVHFWLTFSAEFSVQSTVYLKILYNNKKYLLKYLFVSVKMFSVVSNYIKLKVNELKLSCPSAVKF